MTVSVGLACMDSGDFTRFGVSSNGKHARTIEVNSIESIYRSSIKHDAKRRELAN